MSPLARQYLIAQRRLHVAVSVLTLAATGLLVSVGFGLHDLCGCQHACVKNTASQTPSESSGAVIASGDRCELCDLLAQNRYVPTPAPRPVGLATPSRTSAAPYVGAACSSPIRWPSPRGPPVIV